MRRIVSIGAALAVACAMTASAAGAANLPPTKAQQARFQRLARMPHHHSTGTLTGKAKRAFLKKWAPFKKLNPGGPSRANGGRHANYLAGIANNPIWSGYDIEGGTFGGSYATWEVPYTYCNRSGEEDVSNWVGLGDGSDVAQTGTVADCYAGGVPPLYHAWWEVYPQSGAGSSIFPVTVHAYDWVSAQVFKIPGTSNVQMALQDWTAGWTQYETFSCSPACEQDSVEWITESATTQGNPHYLHAQYSSPATGLPTSMQYQQAQWLDTGGSYHPMVDNTDIPTLPLIPYMMTNAAGTYYLDKPSSPLNSTTFNTTWYNYS